MTDCRSWVPARASFVVAAIALLAMGCAHPRTQQDERVAQIRLVAMAAGGNLVVTFPHAGGSRGLILRASPEYLERRV